MTVSTSGPGIDDDVVAVVPGGTVEAAPQVIRRNTGRRVRLQMRRVGRAVLGRRSTRSTRNDRAPPPCSPTTIRSPRRSSPSRKNTAGPRRESTCPTITAGPASPGRGPGSYQRQGRPRAPPSSCPPATRPAPPGRRPRPRQWRSTPAALPRPAQPQRGSEPPPRHAVFRRPPWHPTGARHPASTATVPTTRQPGLPGRPIAAAGNPTRRRRVLRPRARGTRTRRTRTRRTRTRRTRTRRCRVPRWGTLPPPGIGARRAVHNPRPGEPVPTSGRDPPQGMWVRAAVHIPLRSERRWPEVTGRSRCPSGGGGRSRPTGRRGRGRRR
jgi:hypothetical protein